MPHLPPRPWGPGSDEDDDAEDYPGQLCEGPEARMARQRAEEESTMSLQIERLLASVTPRHATEAVPPYRYQRMFGLRRWARWLLPPALLLLFASNLAGQTLVKVGSEDLVGVWAMARPLGDGEQWSLIRFLPDSTNAVVGRFVDADGPHEEPLLPIRTGHWRVTTDPWGQTPQLCINRDPPPTPTAMEIHWAKVICTPFRFEHHDDGTTTLWYGLAQLTPATPDVLARVGLRDF